jgi:hypothetical protein
MFSGFLIVGNGQTDIAKLIGAFFSSNEKPRRKWIQNDTVHTYWKLDLTREQTTERP